MLAVVDPDAPGMRHVGIVGNTYTTLLSGADTAGRFCLVDMHVPPGGGPAPHRHDFEETVIVLEGEIELTFRGEKVTARAGRTVNVPANAPHAFTNVSDRPARLLCLCAPAGQEELFTAIGVPVDSRTALPPKPGAAEQQALMKKAEALAPQYRTEMLKS